MYHGTPVVECTYIPLNPFLTSLLDLLLVSSRLQASQISFPSLVTYTISKSHDCIPSNSRS